MKIKLLLIKGIIFGLLMIFKILPHSLSLKIGCFIGQVLFKNMKERTKVAIDNLKLVYSRTMTDSQCRDLAQKNFEHLGRALFEILYVLAVPGRLEKILTIIGDEHLQAALAKNKGIVIVTGHLGNFFFLAAALCRKYQAKFLYRRPSQPVAAVVYDWLLTRLGIQTIADNPRHLCAYHSYAHLKKKGVLGILIDQVETGGMYVDFMGHPAGSTLGAGNMALKSGAPIVPAYCYRLHNEQLKVEIEPEFLVNQQGNYEKKLADIVAGTNKVVEKWVHRVPEQWFWGHRRWRKWRK